jgi:hypothetical protein
MALSAFNAQRLCIVWLNVNSYNGNSYNGSSYNCSSYNGNLYNGSSYNGKLFYGNSSHMATRLMNRVISNGKSSNEPDIFC